MRTLIGHEYEVRLADVDGVEYDGWFRARYLTATARSMGWLWEFEDNRLRLLGIEEATVVDVRAVPGKGGAA
jgi:hypothetical protein